METLQVNRGMQANYLNKFNINEFYNATMTFRLDSDIYSPYSGLSWILKLLWCVFIFRTVLAYCIGAGSKGAAALPGPSLPP